MIFFKIDRIDFLDGKAFRCDSKHACGIGYSRFQSFSKWISALMHHWIGKMK